MIEPLHAQKSVFVDFHGETSGGLIPLISTGALHSQLHHVALQDTSEAALHGGAVLTRLLIGMLGPSDLPEALQRAACTLHDKCLLVSWFGTGRGLESAAAAVHQYMHNNVIIGRIIASS